MLQSSQISTDHCNIQVQNIQIHRVVSSCNCRYKRCLPVYCYISCMDTCKKKKKQQVDPNVASCIVSHTVNCLFILGQTHRQAFEMIHVKKIMFFTHTNTNTHGRAVNCTLSSALNTHRQVRHTVERQPWQRRLQRTRSSPSLRSALQTRWLEARRSQSARQSKRYMPQCVQPL